MSRLRLGELVGQSTAKIVVNKDPSKPYIGLEHLAPGSPRVLGAAHSSVSTSTNSIFEPGDILFGKLRPYLKKSAMATFSGYCSTDILVLRATAGTDAAFAARVLQSDPVFAEATATAVGTKMPRTSWRELAKLETFVPPLPEQQLIASILDTVDEVIRKTEEVIAKLQQMKQGLLHDLLTRGIDDNGELRDPDRHPEQFKDSPLGRIPKDWEVEALGEFAEVLNGTTPSRAVPGYWGGDIPWLSSARANDYRVVHPSEFITASALQSTSLRVLPEGATIIGMIGQGKTRGKAARLALAGATINQNLAGVIPGERLDSVFLHVYLHRSYEQLRSSGRGSNQDAMNCEIVRRFPVSVPSLEEQRRISSVVENAEVREDTEQAELAKLRLLKSGLMDDLLTGRVRVTDLLP